MNVARTVSGQGRPSDPSLEPNQYPTPGASFFGIALPDGTGAPGTQGGYTPIEDTADAVVTVTPPGGAGPDRVVPADLNGPDDWTGVSSQYPLTEPISGVSLPRADDHHGRVTGPQHPNAANQDGEPR
jgi:hypothetical protein